MTIEVIKAGPKKFRASCEKCLTEFTYGIDDLKLSYRAIDFGTDCVCCPGCGAFVSHRHGRRWCDV